MSRQYSGLVTDDQLQSVVNEICSRTKSIFISKAAYENQINSLNARIVELEGIIDTIKQYHNIPEDSDPNELNPNNEDQSNNND